MPARQTGVTCAVFPLLAEALACNCDVLFSEDWPGETTCGFRDASYFRCVVRIFLCLLHRERFSHRCVRVSSLLAVALAGAFDAGAADVALYALIKERSFLQTNATPVLQPSGGFSFTALVLASPNAALQSAYVQRGPGGTTINLSKTSGSQDFLLRQVFSTQAALDTAFPNLPNYIMGIQTTLDGLRTPQVNLSSGVYPPAPVVANLAAAGDIAAGSNFVLQWNAFPGGLTNDLVQVVITDAATNVVFNSPLIGQSGALNGTSTSINVPADTLAPGRGYIGNVIFGHVRIETLNALLVYPGVPGGTSFATRTVFPIRTRALVPSKQPRLRVAGTGPSTITLQFDTEAGFTYRLLAATNPVSPNWTTILTTNASGTNVTFVDGAVESNKERYFKVVSP